MLAENVKGKGPVLDYGGHWCKGRPASACAPLAYHPSPLRSSMLRGIVGNHRINLSATPVPASVCFLSMMLWIKNGFQHANKHWFMTLQSPHTQTHTDTHRNKHHLPRGSRFCGSGLRFGPKISLYTGSMSCGLIQIRLTWIPWTNSFWAQTPRPYHGHWGKCPTSALSWLNQLYTA